MNANPSEKTPVAIVLWTIWLALFSGLFFHRFFLGSGLAVKDNWDQPPGWLALALLLGPVLLSAAIRWMVLPRFNQPATVLVPFIVGMAVSESLAFFGIFLFRGLETVFFGASLLCALQFIPVGLGQTEKSSAEGIIRVNVK